MSHECVCCGTKTDLGTYDDHKLGRLIVCEACYTSGRLAKFIEQAPMPEPPIKDE